jgi:hypothetical protein
MPSHFNLVSSIGKIGLKTNKGHKSTELCNYFEISLPCSIINKTRGSHKYSKK